LRKWVESEGPEQLEQGGYRRPFSRSAIRGKTLLILQLMTSHQSNVSSAHGLEWMLCPHATSSLLMHPHAERSLLAHWKLAVHQQRLSAGCAERYRLAES
jgi:hypothetical protein